MKIVPPVQVTRFEQLQPGDLFIFIERSQSFYALKTQSTGDRSEMVLLGPTFIQEAPESILVSWQAVTVLSLGKDYSVLLPTDPGLWSLDGPNRTPVCLAVAGDSAYICANGGQPPHRYFPCFVEMKTGAILERSLPSIAAFTNNWEIAILSPTQPPHSILKYPLP